jgi:hypothetical protein
MNSTLLVIQESYGTHFIPGVSMPFNRFCGEIEIVGKL